MDADLVVDLRPDQVNEFVELFRVTFTSTPGR